MNSGKVLVVYNGYIPESIVSEFIQNCAEAGITEISSRKEEPQYHNFTDDPLYDLAIYIKDHGDVIAGGVLVRLAYDIFKETFKTIWKKLKELKVKKVSGEKVLDKEVKIAVRFGDGTKFVEVVLEQNFDIDNPEEFMESLSRFLNSSKLNEFLNNPDCQLEKGKPKIRVIYNPESQAWEAINLKELRQFILKFQEEARRKYTN
jgi:hypothetical protein